MDAKSLVQWAVGLGIIVLLFRLLKRDPETLAAEEVGKLWELKAGALKRAADEGLLLPYQIEELARNPVLLAGMAVDADALYNAPANWYAWDDDERRAVASVLMRTTFPELVFFTNYFAERYRIPVDAHLLSFMSPSGLLGDAPELAAIVQHVKQLRPR